MSYYWIPVVAFRLELGIFGELRDFYSRLCTYYLLKYYHDSVYTDNKKYIYELYISFLINKLEYLIKSKKKSPSMNFKSDSFISEPSVYVEERHFIDFSLLIYTLYLNMLSPREPRTIVLVLYVPSVSNIFVGRSFLVSINTK